MRTSATNAGSPLNRKEHNMNREFNPTSGRIRATFAAAAMVATILVAISIDGLIDHYNGVGTGLASAGPVVIAQR